jgi:hypothetical protein
MSLNLLEVLLGEANKFIYFNNLLFSTFLTLVFSFLFRMRKMLKVPFQMPFMERTGAHSNQTLAHLCVADRKQQDRMPHRCSH